MNRTIYIILFSAFSLIYFSVLILFYNFALPNSSGPQFPVLLGDSSEYVLLAQNILKNGVFSMDETPPFRPDYFRTPGYPLFLALIFSFFESPYAISVVQIILAAATAFLIFKIGEKLVSPIAGFSVSLLYILNPSTLLYSIVVMSDTLFVFILVLSVYLMFFLDNESEKLLILATGILTGFLVLIRPIGIFLPVLLIFFYLFLKAKSDGGFFSKKLFVLILIFAAAYGTVLAPWIIRNKLHSGAWGISSAGSYNMFTYNVPLFLTFKYNQSLSTSQNLLYGSTNSLKKEMIKDIRYSRELDEASFKYIKDDPFYYTAFHLSRVFQFFGANSSKNFYVILLAVFTGRTNPFPEHSLLLDDILNKNFGAVYKRLRSQLFFAFEYVVWGAILFLSAVSLFSRERRAYGLFFICIAIYFAVLTGPVVDARYRLPAEPFMFLSALLGFCALRDRIGGYFYEKAHKKI